MRTLKTLKREKISHLQCCLDALALINNHYTDEDCEYLYRNIFEIINTMEVLEEVAALDYFRKEIEMKKIKESLKQYNIVLIV